MADAQRALLTVHQLVTVARHRPIHGVEREGLAHGVDHLMLLLVLVNHLALVGGADVQPPAETAHPSLAFVLVAIDQFGHLRSEEHTSELQSLMLISYAVFCLK